MKNWIIAILLISTWFIESITNWIDYGFIKPFIFSNSKIDLGWFAYVLSDQVNFIIIILCLLIKPQTLHWIVSELIRMTLIFALFSLFWFIAFFNNPVYESYLLVKVIVGIIYIFVILINQNGRGDKIKSRHNLDSMDYGNDVHNHN